MQLYFIRHGQSANNAHWSDPGYQESPDPVLTPLGLVQAETTANYLANARPLPPGGVWEPAAVHAFTHIYTSLMERAVHTASFTAGRLGLAYEAWDVHESGGIFGRTDGDRLVGLPGHPRAWFETGFPGLRLPASLDGSGWWNRPFETEAQCQQRAERVWRELLERHAQEDGQPEACVAFFSHGGFFMHLMCAILGLPWRTAANGLQSWFLLSNCSVSRIDVRKGEVVLCYLNRTAHLGEQLTSG